MVYGVNTYVAQSFYTALDTLDPYSQKVHKADVESAYLGRYIYQPPLYQTFLEA